MKVRWKTFLLRFVLWLSLEVLLGTLGVDTMADYSEFLSEIKRSSVRKSMVHTMLP